MLMMAIMQRPKKSELAGWQLSTRKIVFATKKPINGFRDKRVCVNCFCNKKCAQIIFATKKCALIVLGQKKCG